MPIRYTNRSRTRGTNGRRRFNRRSRKASRKTRRTSRRPIRGMSKRAILNATSRKKQDNMQIFTNVTTATPQGGTTYASTAAVLTATQQYIFPWVCTARDLSRDSGLSRGLVSDQATRTAQTCFMRGLSENIEISTNDGMPWQWRRVCFTLKGPAFTGNTTTGYAFWTQNSSGYTRTVNTAYGNTYVGLIQSIIFKGAAGVDWSNLMTAPTDNTTVSIKYDKTVTIAAGNEEGTIRNYRRWHPMNKNLVYNDDEQGGGEVSSVFSTPGKPGMGDYYVIDIFQPRAGGTSSSQLRFEPSARLYWHEK